MAKKQPDPKRWEVTMRGNWFEDGKKTVVVEAANNFDAKSAAVMKEFGHMFTGIFAQTTAKLVKG